MRLAPSLAPLRHRAFARFWTGAFVSNVGTWMETVAVGILVTEQTDQAGWAGLVAAAEATARGAEVLVLEKLERPGGSMRLSSGVVWRHSELADFRRECPGGDPVLQALVHERLDDDLAWLESLGALVVARETGNPRTVGVRFDTAALTSTLAEQAGEQVVAHHLRAGRGRLAAVVALVKRHHRLGDRLQHAVTDLRSTCGARHCEPPLDRPRAE